MHGQSHEMHEMNFEDQNAYESWLKTYQEQNFVRYIQNSSRKNKEKSKIIFFNCNRDGKSKSKFKKNNIRDAKKSIKINDFCTSRFSCKIDPDGRITVKLYPTHYNHQIDESQKCILQMSRSDVEQIKEKLGHGVSSSKIRADLAREANSLPKEQSRPAHFKTRQDVYYIKKTLGNINGQYDNEDYKSVLQWIEKYPEMLRYSKFQGEIDPKHKVIFYLLFLHIL